ncbi:MAG: DUF3667 domain-containing protein [Hyphomonadaceae bacterium]
MSGELEAAGAFATAGLAAGAIEGREPGEAHDGQCANCGAPLQGAFCHACGQAAHPHRSLGHVFEEFLHGIVHFDTKAWRTLPMLAFRPGTLTRNYVYGKRARYISPLALFLFTIFFMFAVFAFTGATAPVNITETGSVADAQAALDEARTNLAEAQASLDEVTANPDPDQPEGLEVSLARNTLILAQEDLERREQTLLRAQQREAAAASGANPQTNEIVQIGVDATDGEPAELTWQDVARGIAESEDFVVIAGWDSFNHKAREKLRDPDFALYKIQQAAYKFSFLLIPISLPFIALLFLWKRGVTLYDHVVFALYSLSFVSILFVALVLAGQVSWLAWTAPAAVLLGIPVHTFFHLKGAYALGWWSALWRTVFMLAFAIISLGIFLIAIVILGLAG